MKTNSACYSARRKKEKDNQKKEEEDGIPTAAQEFEKYCSFRLARMCVQNKLCKKTKKKKQNEHNEDKSFFCFANDYKATTTCAFNWNMHELLKTRVITYKRERKEKRTKEKKLRISLILKHTRTGFVLLIICFLFDPTTWILTYNPFTYFIINKNC